MVISRTPFRISFFGGGTDFPSWYREHGGSVLATTINKYCYLTCRFRPPFWGDKFRIVYSKTETANSIDEIEHPAVREILRYMKLDRPLEIHHEGDLPARSGVGSSSSFTVGLLHALYALKGMMPNKHQLAKESIYLEREVLKETVGSQDQVLAAHGGFQHVIFHPGDEVSLRPVTLPPGRIAELANQLMLFYTGVDRVGTASDVAKSYAVNVDNQKRQMRIIQGLVDEAISILSSDQPIKLFGELLNESWQIKRTLSAQVSTPVIDSLYNQALECGAVGGKLIGAGGGGFLLLFAPPGKQQNIREKFSKLIEVPFGFENLGSQVIFYDNPNEDIKSVFDNYKKLRNSKKI